jgi:hypothetical protein
MGRRSPASTWIADIGGRPPIEEAEDGNFVYYTQYFTGPRRPRRLGRALVPMGVFTILTLDGDNDTWSVTLFTTANNRAMRAAREVAAFCRVVSACPNQAHWLDGTPITPNPGHGWDPRPLSAVRGGGAARGDRLRCGGRRLGLHQSLGSAGAERRHRAGPGARNAVRRHIDDPAALALA